MKYKSVILKMLIGIMFIVYYVTIMLFFIRFVLGITPEEWAKIPMFGV